jgi:DHA3 family multidrug efflux protein-like MFS transporter
LPFRIAAGVGLGLFGMFWVLVAGVGFTLLAIGHLVFVRIPEPHQEAPAGTAPARKSIDIKGTLAVVRSIRGLLPLIFFTTFNNFLGGVFMALMDAYGLTLTFAGLIGLAVTLVARRSRSARSLSSRYQATS